MGELVERVDERDRVMAVVERGEAIRERWLHRVATIVCRDGDGRFLVHRRPDRTSRFPGQLNGMLGGAVDVGESYEQAAAGELAEELGVHAERVPRVAVRRPRDGLAAPRTSCAPGVAAAAGSADSPRSGSGDRKRCCVPWGRAWRLCGRRW
ncbi:MULTISPECIES: NUDIX domain-containing protein [unclassified Streptomyces]|uniref:NUDIX domain-containing protein n=1 Tax=unclassified Streptomyces TaxID=2593676 RepID=UPI00035E69B1|nr:MULTISPECIES: NUDIX domain-containing protein [unclassified Streptomyces]